MHYEEVQNNEVEALKAIYGPDFEALPVESVWNQRPAPKFVITLRPSSDFKDSPIELALQVQMTPTYPNTKPNIEIVRSNALSGRQIEVLRQSISQTCVEMLQTEMIFEVTSNVQSQIDEWARSVSLAAPSLEEDRLRRLQIEEAKQTQRQDELQRQRELAARREEQRYDSLILQEITKSRSEVETDDSLLQRLIVVPEKTFGVTTFERVIEVAPPFAPIMTQFRQVMAGIRVPGPQIATSYLAKALVPVSRTRRRRSSSSSSSRRRSSTSTLTALMEDSDIVISLVQIAVSAPYWKTPEGTRALHDLNTELETMKALLIPGIVPLSEFSIERVENRLEWWRINLVTPLSRLTPLSDVLNNTGTISLKTTQRWVLQILEALGGLHKRGIRHKLVCAYNVMINNDPATGETSVFLRNAQYLYHLQSINEAHPFVVDEDGSGVVTSATEVSPNTSRRASEPGFRRERLTADAYVCLPPESRKKDVAPSSKWDMWQLGALMTLMVAGKYEMQRWKFDAEAYLRSRPRNIPSVFCKFALKLLHGEPAKRPGALELLTDEFFRTDFDLGFDEIDDRVEGLHTPSEISLEEDALGLGALHHSLAQAIPRSSSAVTLRSDHQLSNFQRNHVASLFPERNVQFAQQASNHHHHNNTGGSHTEGNPLGSTGRRRLSGNEDLVYSRYKHDFDEGIVLGKGGFGQVVKARNKLDGRVYAVKKIRATPSTLSHILQEVVLLSRLNHQYVVRYYTVWLEDETDSGTLPAGANTSSISGGDDGGAGRLSLSTESESSDAAIEFDSRSRSTVDEISRQSVGDAIPSTSLSQFSGPHSLSELDFPSVSQDFMSDSGFVEFGYSDSEAVVMSDDENTDVSGQQTDSTAVEPRQASRTQPTRISDEIYADRKRKEKRLSNERLLSSKIVSQTTRKTLYIQMEYCENHTLGDLVRQGLYKTPKEYWRLLRQILDALSYIHGEGVIHRDLKPKNIFIDQARNIKIGDFGLARSMVQPTQSRQPSVDLFNGNFSHGPSGSSSGSMVNNANGTANAAGTISATASDYEEFTTDVGTSLYAAVEITGPDAHNKRGYNEKVDIFSLGIIFFEMVWKMETEMERIIDIKKARTPQIELPKELTSNREKSVEVALIRCMLDHDPNRRPSAHGLLKSGRIPVEESDMTVVEALHNMRDHRVVQQIVNALFSRPLISAQQVLYDRINVSPSVMAALAAQDPQNAQQQQSLQQQLTRRAKPRVSDSLGCLSMADVVDTLRSVFRSHGAVDNTLFRSRLFPRSPLYKVATVVEFVDVQGTVLQLPYDLTLPHARRLAEVVPNYKKAFAVDTVFRNRLQNPGQHPAKHVEVDFDIMSTDDSEDALVYDEAETIGVMYDSANRVLSLEEQNDLIVVIGHHDILSASLSHCGLSPPQFHAALVLLASGSLDRRNSGALARSSVSTASMDMLGQFAFRESIQRAEARMSRLMPLSQRVRHGLSHVTRVAETFKRLCGTNRDPSILFSPLVHSMTPDFFVNGVMFQLIDVKNLQGNARQYSSGSVLAVGGRYDSLVQSFRNTLLDSRTPLVKVVGFGMSADKLEMLATKQAQAQQQLYHNNSLMAQKSVQVTPRCQVLISSLSDQCLHAQGLDTARVLWSLGVSTDIVWGVSSNDEIVASAQEGHIPLVIMIKQANSLTALSATNTTFKPLRVKRVGLSSGAAQGQGDVDLMFSELVPFIQQELGLNLGPEDSSGGNTLLSPLAELAGADNTVVGKIVSGIANSSSGLLSGSGGLGSGLAGNGAGLSGVGGSASGLSGLGANGRDLSNGNLHGMEQTLSSNKVLVLLDNSRAKGGRKNNRWQLEEKSVEARANFLVELSNAPVVALDLKDDVIQAILSVHPAAADDWKRRVVGIAQNQKAYILHTQSKIAHEAARSPRLVLYSIKTENVFIYNY